MKLTKKQKITVEIELAVLIIVIASFLVIKSCSKSDFHLFKHAEHEQIQQR